MKDAKELEVIDQLLDSSRKLSRYVDDLPDEHKEIAIAIKREFNKLLNQALDIYFHSESKAQDLADILFEVQALLERGASPESVYDRLVA